MKPSYLDWYADGADYSEVEEKKYWWPWVLLALVLIIIWRSFR